MRKYLLPETGQFYKANLHAHTSMSDGKDTPEEVKEIFKAMGYSIVAYTDHDVFVDRSDSGHRTGRKNRINQCISCR